MAAENQPEPDLGELANRTGKREFPETEKNPDFHGEGLPKRARISSDDIFGRETTMRSIGSAQALPEENEEVSGIEGTELSDGVGKSEYEEAHDLVLSQCGSIDIPALPESQESKNGDSIKACSCRFCTKAAYIWLDLNFQDVKARVSGERVVNSFHGQSLIGLKSPCSSNGPRPLSHLSQLKKYSGVDGGQAYIPWNSISLKKSRKEATLAGERSVWRRTVAVTDRHCGVVEHLSETEYDLMCQWRSLFRRMAEVNERECNELEARLLELNGLRDRCKTDLEMIVDELKRS